MGFGVFGYRLPVPVMASGAVRRLRGVKAAPRVAVAPVPVMRSAAVRAVKGPALRGLAPSAAASTRT